MREQATNKKTCNKQEWEKKTLCTKCSCYQDYRRIIRKMGGGYQQHNVMLTKHTYNASYNYKILFSIIIFENQKYEVLISTCCKDNKNRHIYCFSRTARSKQYPTILIHCNCLQIYFINVKFDILSQNDPLSGFLTIISSHEARVMNHLHIIQDYSKHGHIRWTHSLLHCLAH